MHLIPTVIEKDKNHQYAYDIYSKLLEERIILLTGTIDDAMPQQIVLTSHETKFIVSKIASPAETLPPGELIYM